MIYLSVPAGTRVAKTCSCGVKLYFIPAKTPGKRPIPVNCECEGGQPPTADDPGRGLNHFADCPDRDTYRKPRT